MLHSSRIQNIQDELPECSAIFAVFYISRSHFKISGGDGHSYEIVAKGQNATASCHHATGAMIPWHHAMVP